MWTPATRRRHSREHLRYASDVSDEEWALLEPHLPAPCLTGRPRAWPMREIVNAIFYVLRSGCAWRLLPDSFPPRQTVYGWFLRLRDDCVLEWLNPSGHARPRAAGAPPALRRGCSTAKASRRRRPAGRGATTPARRSRVESATPSSTPTVVPWCWSLTRPTSRTATAAGPCWLPRATPFPSSRRSLPTAATPGSGLPAPPPSPSRSFARTPTRSASPSSPGAGSSSASSPGSAATAASPRTSRQPSNPPEPSSTPPPSCCSPDGSRNQDEFRVGLLGSPGGNMSGFGE